MTNKSVFQNLNYLKIINIAWRVFIGGMIALVVYVLSVGFNLFGLFGPMPNYEALENPKSDLASEVYSSDGVVLGRYFRENRSPAKYDQISKNVINALIATEDVRFNKHSGIDFKGTIAIPFYLVMGDRRGSSTLSQQLAKNLFRTREKQYQGALSGLPLIGKVVAKTKEWILAIRLERAYTKEEIITMYLNTVDFGSHAYGIKVAAKTYFDTSPDSLDLPEAAVLIGMLKGPSIYNPITRPERALLRRNTVMNQMVKYGFLTDAQYDILKVKPIETKHYEVENQNSGLATYFRSVLQTQLTRWCDSMGYDLYSDGLKIYTTIDSRMQEYAEAAMETQMKSLQKVFFQHWKGRNPWTDAHGMEIPGFLEKAMQHSDRYKKLKASGMHEGQIRRVMNTPVKMRVFTWNKGNHETDTLLSPMDSIRYYKHFLRTGMMSLDPHTGHIKAWVGGINHKHFKYDHVLQGRRQPGSTFKPIVYSAAIDLDPITYNPCTAVQDVPQTFRLPDGRTWTPSNSGSYSGETYTLRQALARSINTGAAMLMSKFTPLQLVQYAKKLGVTSRLDTVPSLCLGVSDVSVYEMAGVYGAIVNQGMWTEPIYLVKIEDKNGKVLYMHAPRTREVMSEETAYVMTYMLRGPVEEQGGTARNIQRYNFSHGNQVGGKTGTTNNNADGWFIGITKDLATAVWVGGEDRSIHFRTTDLGAGGKTSLPIFANYLEKVYADPTLRYSKGEFPKPEKISIKIDCSATDIQQGDTTDTDTYTQPTDDPLKGL